MHTGGILADPSPKLTGFASAVHSITYSSSQATISSGFYGSSSSDSLRKLNARSKARSNYAHSSDHIELEWLGPIRLNQNPATIETMTHEVEANWGPGIITSLCR
jgi:hypothetical protein